MAPAAGTGPPASAGGVLHSRDALPRLLSSLDSPHAEGTEGRGAGERVRGEQGTGVLTRSLLPGASHAGTVPTTARSPRFVRRNV